MCVRAYICICACVLACMCACMHVHEIHNTVCMY